MSAMQTIVLLGEVNWESMTNYHKMISTIAKQTLRGLHSAKTLIAGFDLESILAHPHGNEWDQAGLILVEAARLLERPGAHFVIAAWNTTHKVVDQICAHWTSNS
jgi:aspartate racemase